MIWWQSECTGGIIKHKSRFEETPGSGFQPRDENTKIDCGFSELLGAIKK